MSTDRYAEGLKHLKFVENTDNPSVIKALESIAPDLAKLTIEFAYGDVYARPQLSPRHRQIATVAALAALGNARPQLAFHIAGALNVGCTPREVIETLIQLVPYCGFPATLNGIFVAKEVFGDKYMPLIQNEKSSGELPDTKQRYQNGLKALENIDGEAGVKVIQSLKDISPDLGRFIIEFAFGDIYTRKGLDLVSREIATVAALAAIGTATPQLKVHIHGLLNVGGSQKQLVETIIHIAVYAGFPAAINAMMAAKDILAERDLHAAK